MTGGELSIARDPWRAYSPRGAAITMFFLVVGAGLLSLAVLDEHPRSNWFYPALAVVGLLVGVRDYWRLVQMRSTHDSRTISVRLLPIWVAISGALTAIAVAILFRLLEDDWRGAHFGMFFGWMTAVVSGYPLWRTGQPWGRERLVLTLAWMVGIVAGLLAVERIAW